MKVMEDRMSAQENLIHAIARLADRREELEELTRRLAWLEEHLKRGGQASSLPELMDIRTTCRVLGGISRSTIYRMIEDGRLESVRVGGRRMITARSVGWHLP